MTDTNHPILSCTTVAAYSRGPSWQLQPHALSDRHQLIWISRGGGRMQIDGLTRGFGTHVAVFLPAGTVAAFDFTPATTGWILYIDAAEAAGWPLPGHPQHTIIPDRAVQTALVAICEEITREAERDDRAHATALRCHAGLLAVWIDRHLVSATPLQESASRASALMQRFTRLIEERFSAQTSVASYAALLGVTPTHLSRVCRDIAGKSAGQIIQDRTLLEARRRLSNGSERIGAIAADLGFASSAYFTRLFTQKTGQSPTAFRQQAQRSGEMRQALR